jgi:hypothetical protein
VCAPSARRRGGWFPDFLVTALVPLVSALLIGRPCQGEAHRSSALVKPWDDSNQCARSLESCAGVNSRWPSHKSVEKKYLYRTHLASGLENTPEDPRSDLSAGTIMEGNSYRVRFRLTNGWGTIPGLLVSGIVAMVLVSACGARSSLRTDSGAGGAGGAGGSTASSSGGEAGAGGGQGGAGGGVGGCDPSLPGPQLVEAPAPGGGHFCIDSTEVTNAHYAKWLASLPTTASLPAVCGWNDSFIPFDGWPPAAGKENAPVHWVDWCDAFAYCAAAGKRLCGKIGGGPVAYDEKSGDPMQSQWLNACTAGGTRDFPYGSTYQADVCNDGAFGAEEPISVGQAKDCEGGYPGLFDMVGNVGEWVDSCDGTDGELDSCQIFGGSFVDPGEPPQCMRRWGFARVQTGSMIGIRCCRD